jgi:hypothetical protein
MDNHQFAIVIAAAVLAVVVIYIFGAKHSTTNGSATMKNVGAVVSPSGNGNGSANGNGGTNGDKDDPSKYGPLGGGGGDNDEPALQPGETSGDVLNPQMYQDYVPEQGKSQLEVDDMMPYGFDPDDPNNKNRITVDGIPAQTAMQDQTFYANVGPQLLTKKRFQNTLAIQSAGPGSAAMIDKPPMKKISGINPNRYLRQPPRVPMMQGIEIAFNNSQGRADAYAAMTGNFPADTFGF